MVVANTGGGGGGGNGRCICIVIIVFVVLALIIGLSVGLTVAASNSRSGNTISSQSCSSYYFLSPSCDECPTIPDGQATRYCWEDWSITWRYVRTDVCTWPRRRATNFCTVAPLQLPPATAVTGTTVAGILILALVTVLIHILLTLIVRTVHSLLVSSYMNANIPGATTNWATLGYTQVWLARCALFVCVAPAGSVWSSYLVFVFWRGVTSSNYPSTRSRCASVFVGESCRIQSRRVLSECVRPSVRLCCFAVALPPEHVGQRNDFNRGQQVLVRADVGRGGRRRSLGLHRAPVELPVPLLIETGWLVG